MRRTFASCLLNKAKENENIVLVTMDLGFGLWDEFRDTLPEQFYNVMASEQAGLGIAVGLALSGKVAFVYSITPFLLYRPFETIRNYVNHEKIPVKLIGSGRDKDYKEDGHSHHAEDDFAVLHELRNIDSFWPERKEEIPGLLNEIIYNNKPTYINLRR